MEWSHIDQIKILSNTSGICLIGDFVAWYLERIEEIVDSIPGVKENTSEKYSGISGNHAVNN